MGEIALRYMDCLPASTALPELQIVIWIAYLQVRHFQNYKTLCFVNLKHACMQCRIGIVIMSIAGCYLTDK